MSGADTNVAAAFQDMKWLRSALVAMLPHGVLCEVACISDTDLSDVSLRVSIMRAASKMRAVEFATGRLAARRALLRLGASEIAVGIGADRCPVWPTGFAGSISHSSGFAIAAVGAKSHINSIGIDLEEVGAVDSSIWTHIMTASERRRICGLTSRAQRRFAAVLFSLKESFYKFQYPSTGMWLEFQDVEILLDSIHDFNDSVGFVSSCLVNGVEFPMYGRYHCSDRFVVTTVFPEV
jgi:4'-phosphopantetheinyl transferase EntD